MTFTIHHLGAENQRWRKILLEAGAKAVGLNYASATQRRRLVASTRFPMDWCFEQLMLCASSTSAKSQDEWRETATDYREFAMAHIDEVDLIVECDATALGEDWIAAERRRWDTDKFVPVWHWGQGASALEELGERYGRIAIHADNMSRPGGTVIPILKRLQTAGVRPHGLGLSRVDAIKHVRLDSCSSTSWLSASRFGETIFWDGSQLKRYSTRMKDQARRRHRAAFERAGFDLELLDAEDPDEWNKLTLWSWESYRDSINHAVPSARAGSAPGVPAESREITPVIEDPDRGTHPLPVFGFKETTTFGADGESTRQMLPVVSAQTSRGCTNCFIRERCPAFSEGAKCSFSIPLEIRTPDQKHAILYGTAEMQAQRVAFMRYAEELEGGYADPNLSQEIDRLIKIFVQISEIEDNRDSFEMSIRAKGGQTGILSRIFGGTNGATIPAPPVARTIPGSIDSAEADARIAALVGEQA